MGLGSVIAFLSVLLLMSVTPSDGTETFTKREGKTARINCKISNVGSCQNYIHWYQKKGEASKRILYVSLSGGDGVSDTNHGGADFQARQNGNERYLQIPKVKDSHSATYYCACWVGGIKHFGSGTKLIVSADPPKAPDLTVYPPTPVENGKTAMLCLASNMFPDVVEFDWKNQEGQGEIQSVKDNDNEEVIPQMKIKDKTVISLLIVKQERINNNNVKYYCNVKHEQPTDKVEVKKSAEKKPDQDKKPKSSDSLKPECPPSNATSDTATYDSLQFTGNFNMATLTYSLLILKSVAYCGIVSFLMYQMKSTAGMATRKGVP